MKLIVGLGNPGNEYINTRHNVGFLVLDELASALKVDINKSKYDGLYGETYVNDEKVILLKPQKYMNLSGEVIKKYIDFYKVDINDILIIHDDLDLPVGKIKIKFKGSSGGHNGLKNIEENIKTNNYKRIKIGISNDKMIDTKNYVTGKMKLEELEIINTAIKKMPDIIDFYLNNSFDKLMSKYN